MDSLNRFAVSASHAFQYIPVVSTPTAVVELFLKKILQLPSLEHIGKKSFYLSYIMNKDTSRCIASAIPLAGNISVAIYNCSKKPKQYSEIDFIKETLENLKTSPEKERSEYFSILKQAVDRGTGGPLVNIDTMVLFELIENVIGDKSSANEKDKFHYDDIVRTLTNRCIIKDGEKIEDTAQLVRILKIAAFYNYASVCWNFERYQNAGLKKGEDILDIATIVAKQGGGVISKYIKKFVDAIDKKDLIELAKIDAALDGSAVFENIINYGITDKKDLFEIAKIDAEHRGGEISEYVKVYGITDKNEINELSKILSRSNILKIAKDHQPNLFLTLTEKYNKGEMTEQEHFVEICKVAITKKKDVDEVLKNLRNTSITDQKDLTEIFKIGAAFNGGAVSKNIRHYPMISQKNLIEIAKIAVKENQAVTKYEIKNYGIISQQDLFEIALIGNKGAPLSPSLLKGYGITDKNLVVRTFINNFIEGKIFAPESQYSIDDFDPNKLGPYKKLFLSTNSEDIRSICKEIFADKKDKLKQDSLKFIDELIVKIEKNENAYIKNELYDLLKCQITLHSLSNKELTPIQSKIWISIFEYQDPKMRYHLFNNIHEMNEEKVKVYDSIVNEKSANHTILPAIFLSKLIKNKDLWKDLLPKIQDRFFRDYQVQRPLVNVLHMLKDAHELTEEDIIFLLDSSIDLKNKENTISNLLSIKGIIDLKETQELTKAIFDKNGKDFSKIFQNSFLKHIPIKNVSDFDQKYAKTFGAYRSNDLLFVYAGGLKNSVNPVLGTLATCVENILKGTFKKERYSNSKHLETVFKNRQNLKNDWMTGAKKILNLGTNESTAEQKGEEDYSKFFIDKIITGKHLDASKYPLIHKYLTASENDKGSIEGRLDDEVKKQREEQKAVINNTALEKKDRANQLKEVTGRIKTLELQKSIMSLVKAKDLSRDEQLSALKNIKTMLASVDKFSKLTESIDGLIKSFDVKTVPKQKMAMTIVDTDDPWDLFLCGTEVEGSCQHVSGGSKNEGLLAYLLDGKHRLIAIKDETGKIVGRRILRILLDGKSKEPVLMVERTYPQNLSAELQKELDLFVKQRAKDLSLALYEEGTKDVVKLESQSCKTQHEYVDSAGGMVPNGVYTITQANLVQKAA